MLFLLHELVRARLLDLELVMQLRALLLLELWQILVSARGRYRRRAVHLEIFVCLGEVGGGDIVSVRRLVRSLECALFGLFFFAEVLLYFLRGLVQCQRKHG